MQQQHRVMFTVAQRGAFSMSVWKCSETDCCHAGRPVLNYSMLWVAANNYILNILSGKKTAAKRWVATV